jgi:hypothetical protein
MSVVGLSRQNVLNARVMMLLLKPTLFCLLEHPAPPYDQDTRADH